MDASCDVVECRVDCWPAAVPQALGALASCPVPALITVRGPDEGGRHSLTTAERESLYRRFLPQASLLDIEIACLSDFRDLICEARDRGVLVVASAHDFVRTPEADELRRSQPSGAEPTSSNSRRPRSIPETSLRWRPSSRNPVTLRSV
jgi:3-dehydroquinate dehydratase-1